MSTLNLVDLAIEDIEQAIDTSETTEVAIQNIKQLIGKYDKHDLTIETAIVNEILEYRIWFDGSILARREIVL